MLLSVNKRPKSAMHAGIDFGTSNCLISTAEQGVAGCIPLSEGTPEMPSAIYVLKTAIDAESINDPHHRKTLSDRISDIKREQTLAIKEA